MDWKAWITLAVLILTFAALFRGRGGPDFVLVGAVFILTASGVLTLKEALSGFSNPSVWSIAVLFVVAAALRETGSLSRISPFLFGKGANAAGPTPRMVVSLAAISSVLYNTPVVAMFLPAVADWARHRGISLSRALIPLSYAALLGGTCTLIGTSTNLVISSLMVQNNRPGLDLFTQAPAGIPCALVGLAYLILVAPRLLPDRKEPLQQFGEARREYLVEMQVVPAGPLVGKTVGDAGLRSLPGLFLVQIERRGQVITPVSPDELLEGADGLLFAGVVTSIVDLHAIRGLEAVSQTAEGAAPEDEWSTRLCEAVISSTSPLMGRSIRDADFRTLHDAAVIAVHRNGERLRGKIGDIQLRAGDTLLLKTGPNFVRAHRDYPGFYLVSELEDMPAPRHQKAPIALAIVLVMIVLAAGSPDHFPMLIAAAGASAALLLTHCISGNSARRAVDWQVIVVIGAGLGMSTAFQKTGLAARFADLLVYQALHAGVGTVGVMAALYVLGNLFTEALGNMAAAAMIVPVGLAAATQLNISPIPYMVAVAISCSLAFTSPIGNHTHLLVYGPGGYQFKDFVRVGFPLNVLMAIVAVTSIAFWWRL